MTEQNFLKFWDEKHILAKKKKSFPLTQKTPSKKLNPNKRTRGNFHKTTITDNHIGMVYWLGMQSFNFCNWDQLRNTNFFIFLSNK